MNHNPNGVLQRAPALSPPLKCCLLTEINKYVLCSSAFLSSCPVCQSRQAIVDLSEIKSRRAVMTPKSLAGKLQPLMADALFF